MNSEYEDNERKFDIEICGEHYKTSKSNIVFRYDDIKMCSPATRIYKAFRADDVEEKEQLIIKDYWPADFLDTEDTRLKEMLDDITDSLERELVERSVLTPISCERVKVGDREDHTKGTILRGESPNMSYKIILPKEEGEKGTFVLRGPGSFVDLIAVPSSDDNTDSPSSIDSAEASSSDDSADTSLLTVREFLQSDENRNRKRYVNRWHYRIVYKQVAIPYDELRNLKDMSLVLEHAIQGGSISQRDIRISVLTYSIALQVIHRAGWVHRDLSVGNLYLYVDPVSGEKRGLIGDFEYAQKVGGRGRQDRRIVTLFSLCYISGIMTNLFLSGYARIHGSRNPHGKLSIC